MTAADQTKILLAAAHETAKANGLNITQWADAAGFHRQVVSRWMSGRSGITLENFLRLCEAAWVEVELLTSPKGHKSKKMKDTITISKNNHKIEISIFENLLTIKEVPVRVKTQKGWITDYIDIRELKIGAELEGGIVVENPYL